MYQTINLPFGQQHKSLTLPHQNMLQLLHVQDPPKTNQSIQDALETPINTPCLSDITSSQCKVVILVSDITRPVPTQIILPPILSKLTQASVKPRNISIIVATGLHRKNTPSELFGMLGEAVVQTYSVTNHNAIDSTNLTHLGYTLRGTPINVNKLVCEADIRIATGYIEPHEFAGFTGGRKSILPGVAGIDAINHNHSIEMLNHPKARMGILCGNPVHEDMMEAATQVGVEFLVNVVLNSRHQIADVVAGDMETAHLTGVKFLKQYVTVDVAEKTDIVITSSGYPLDIDLYQSIKAAMTAETIVKEGGVIILLAECREGYGPEAFKEYLTATATPQELYEVTQAKYRADVDHCLFLSRILKKSEVILVTSNPELKFQPTLMKISASLPKALEQAISLTSRTATITALPYAHRMIPQVSGLNQTRRENMT
jgi:nickel-dependent lactate racemase